MQYRIPMIPRRHITILAVAILAAGCSTEDEQVVDLELREAEPAPARHRAGSLLVEFNPAQSNGISVHAQFMEVQGVTPDAAFDALDAWTPDRELDVDSCSIRMPAAADGAAAIRLRMLDVGPIEVSALDHSIRLEGRRVPDLPTFSGVVYGNEEGFDFDEAFLPYEAQARYHLTAAGGPQAGGFGVSLLAPAVPEIETISGMYVVDDAPMLLEGGELALEWLADEGSGTALYLDVVASSTKRLRCRVEDDGSFIVPSQIVDQLAGDRPMQVQLRRVDALLLDIHGVEDGSFVFASTAEATVVR